MKAFLFKSSYQTKPLIAIATIAACLLGSCKKDDSDPVSTTTGRTKVITLLPTSGNLQSGTATFQENTDHSFNVIVDLQNTVKDTAMAIDIHNGTAAAMGRQAIELNSITGTGGAASGTTSNINSVTTADGTTRSMTYDSIIVYPGVVNVSYSAAQDHRHVALGNIQQ